MRFANIKKISNKYKNKKINIDGIDFDSKDEANFYIYLTNKFKNTDIFLQPKFLLQEKFRDSDNILIREINYIADFRINNVVIDIKGFATTDFKLKLKMFKFKYRELKILVGKSKEIIAQLESLTA